MMRIDRNELRDHPMQEDQVTILEAALAAVEPAALIAKRLSVKADSLCINQTAIPLAGRRIWVLSVGKAAVPMAQAVTTLLGSERIAGGVAVTRRGYGGAAGGVRVIEAGHPLPDGTAGAEAVAAVADRVGGDDLVLCLLSGGGSALLAWPPDGVGLAALARTTALLLESGAGIDEVNTVRRHLSRLQGGQLMSRLRPATVVTLVLSDVIGDRLASIASGPTVPDPTSFTDARDVLARRALWDRVPLEIRSHILSGMDGRVPDTPKPGDPAFETAQTYVIGNNGTAVDAAAAAARDLGYCVSVQAEPLMGEARDAGAELADTAVRHAETARVPWAVVAGGETTVTVRGDGHGGRNQELALAAALRIEGVNRLSLAALASDGTDGPTRAAGALVDGETAALARRQGTDPEAGLARNDSHGVLGSVQDLLWTGATRTNVADLCVVLGEPRA